MALLQVSIIRNCLPQFAMLVTAHNTILNASESSNLLHLSNGYYLSAEKSFIMPNHSGDERLAVIDKRIRFFFNLFFASSFL